MSRLILSFYGNDDDYEFDIESESMIAMLHDVRRNVIIMGRASEIKIDRRNSTLCSVKAHGSSNIYIEFETYSFFKYNNDSKERFKVYWNEHKTVIWDTVNKKQVTNKDIYQYLQNNDDK